ncbi:MAG: NAD(P)H-hydrate dehydratase [Candidatus Omnitrophica bacterium]|nr:NAD(P)H-hydrate dehydratase [Candidatus Omnitrophota bacterium]
MNMRLPVRLRKRNPDTHKGDYGFVFVLGGSPGMTGAVCLCARAALRAGAGMVQAGVPAAVHSIIEQKLTEEMSVPLPDEGKGYLKSSSLKEVSAYLSRANVLALGCGASRIPAVQSALRTVIRQSTLPLVIDADGLNAIASRMDVLSRRKSREIVLTPHFGEFSRLTGTGTAEIKKRRKSLAKEFALKYNLTLVLKGHKTIVTDGKRLFENATGNPGMATAGVGDVLTGILAGILAQGVDLFQSACTAVYLHGLAGDYAAKEKTEQAVIASDLIDFLPSALKHMRSRRRK